MTEFFRDYPAVAWAIIVLVAGLLGTGIKLAWAFFKNDRQSVLDRIDEIERKHIKDMKEYQDKVELEFNYVKGEIDKLRDNYIKRFDRVYEKQDAMKEDINKKHTDLMDAITEIKVSVAKLRPK